MLSSSLSVSSIVRRLFLGGGVAAPSLLFVFCVACAGARLRGGFRLSIPSDLSELIEEEPAEDDADEDDEDGESVIEIGGEEEEEVEDEASKAKSKKSWYLFRRWIPILRPEGVLIREDFGVTWDRAHTGEGVRIGRLTPGSLAHRSGFKQGDLIVQVLGSKIDGMKDLRVAFQDWKFEKEPDGERSVTFDIKRVDSSRQWTEETVKVTWDSPKPYRVDAKWNKRENRLDILARHASKFTVFITDEQIKPGTDFYVYVNGIPYHDLVDPENRPEYPEAHRGGMAGDKRIRMMKARAKIAGGWKPDIKFAVEDFLKTRDRSLVMGAKMDFDLTKWKDGFTKARGKNRAPDKKRGEKLKEAVDSFE